MIRIYKDNDTKIVTQGVYKSLYEPLGYKIVIEEKKEKAVDVVQPVVKETTSDKESKPVEESKQNSTTKSKNTKRSK